MNYFILSNNKEEEEEEEEGQFSIEELKNKKIKKETIIWHQGLDNWTQAVNIKKLENILLDTPPPAPQIESIENDTNIDFIYHDHFNTNNLSKKQLLNYKYNSFYSKQNVWLGIFLHFTTLGIYTFFWYGLQYSKLPKIKEDDFESSKAIGFSFIPLFNFYWIFIFWRRLVVRTNLQFKLRNKITPISIGLATTIPIFYFLPYLGFIVNYFIHIPILFYQTQSAINKLAEENIQKKFN